MNIPFLLLHRKGDINTKAPLGLEYPHADTSNITYVFGHDPVPLLHRKMRSSFSFDYRRAFSWIDSTGNRYYNLDLSSNPIVALRLDDMSEHYVGLPTTRNNATTWDVPNDVLPVVGTDYEWTDMARFGNATFDHAAIISKDNGCQEFVIGISRFRKSVYYARISWMDYRHGFTIENWLDNQTIEEIIEKVREDFRTQCDTPDGKWLEQRLRGAELEKGKS